MRIQSFINTCMDDIMFFITHEDFSVQLQNVPDTLSDSRVIKRVVKSKCCVNIEYTGLDQHLYFPPYIDGCKCY